MEEIVILSGKGGTGKTSISAAFATLGKNMVVADCDVDAANLYLILQPDDYKEVVYVSGHTAVIDKDICTNCGICVDNCRFDAVFFKDDVVTVSETICEGCKLCSRVCPVGAIEMRPSDNSRWYEGNYRNGILVHARLYPGEENSGKLVSVVRENVRKIANEKNVDLVLLDGPPGTGCPVISSLTGVDKTLIVTEPTNSGFHDLKRILQLSIQFKVKSYVLINKYDLNEDVATKIEDWCLSENIPVIGKVPFDKQVVEAMVQCKSIVEYAPDSPSSKVIKEVYSKIISK